MNLRELGKYPAASSRLDALAQLRQKNTLPVQRQPEIRHPREAVRGPEMHNEESLLRAIFEAGAAGAKGPASLDQLADVRPESFKIAEMPSSPADLSSILKGTAGASRAAGDFIKRKRWYHGTGTKGLTPESVDPYVTNPQSLYGQGLYLTDDSYTIPSGYAKSRQKKKTFLQEFQGDAPPAEEVIYEAKVSPKKVLDLDDPATPEIREIFAAQYEVAEDAMPSGFSLEPRPNLEHAPRLKKALKKKNASTAEIWDGFREDLKDEFSDGFHEADEFAEVVQGVTYNLQQKGYDALTHTGGARTGNDPHQVLIMLDPNDAERLGSGGIDRLTEQPGAQYPKGNWPMFRK